MFANTSRVKALSYLPYFCKPSNQWNSVRSSGCSICLRGCLSYFRSIMSENSDWLWLLRLFNRLNSFYRHGIIFDYAKMFFILKNLKSYTLWLQWKRSENNVVAVIYTRQTSLCHKSNLYIHLNGNISLSNFAFTSRNASWHGLLSHE